ncbi:PAS fold-4 domain protein [Rhizobium sp. PDO1-076]|uniref:PAS domain-containing protein n=1 Tax=Rhizobium sp. PDO1-076 TaxID=1125979 RepID=UPI00024E3A86|nr:PAS domain-containing protein [Rhizobium sp. PDO1-076]EHS53911.1 PAS fold-4 domain protein [Rhizobium sp. PDO1-076]
MSSDPSRDGNLLPLFEAVSLKNVQLQQAIRSGNDRLVAALDRELDPLICEMVAYRASEADEIYLQLHLLTKLLREDADDRSCVLRHTALMSILIERYFGPRGLARPTGDAVVSMLDSKPQPAFGDDDMLNEVILSSLPDRIAVVTRDYRYLFANPAMADMLRTRPIDIIGRSVFELGLQPDAFVAMRDALDHAFRGESGDFASRFNGGNHLVSAFYGRFTPLRSSQGAINGAVLTFSDGNVGVNNLAA